MATSEGIPSSIDIEFLELNDNPYLQIVSLLTVLLNATKTTFIQNSSFNLQSHRHPKDRGDQYVRHHFPHQRENRHVV